MRAHVTQMPCPVETVDVRCLSRLVASMNEGIPETVDDCFVLGGTVSSLHGRRGRQQLSFTNGLPNQRANARKETRCSEEPGIYTWNSVFTVRSGCIRLAVHA